MNNLKKLRLLAEKTQVDIARETNIPQTTYSCYENGRTTPDTVTLIKLADYFHTTIDSILGHEVPYLLDRSLLSNEQNELIDIVKNLSPADCQMLSAYAEGIVAGKQKAEFMRKFNTEGNKWK